MFLGQMAASAPAFLPASSTTTRPDEARRLVDTGEQAVIVASLCRSLDNADYALMHIHPAHPRHGIVTLDRELVRALLAKLGGESQ
jgi:hypothetical protein